MTPYRRSHANAVAVSTDHESRQAIEMEKALLGALLLDCATAWPQVKDVVGFADFARHDHQLIFAAVAEIVEDGGNADPFLVVDRLGAKLEVAGGSEYIAGLFEEATSAASAGIYAKRIRERSRQGNVVNLADVLAARARNLSAEDALRFAQEQIERLRREQAEPDAPLWPQPLDVATLLATEPVKPPMIIEDWLPAGYATMIAGHGGAGKSSIALHLACAIAQGRAWWGLSTAPRRVIYLSCEDRANVIQWRLHRICNREGWGAAGLSRIVIRDLVGYGSILYRSSFDGLMPTREYAELARIMAEDPTALLVVDGVSDTFGGNENDRGQVKTFVNALVRLVTADGAVLLVHHVNKQGANSAVAEGYSGSTGWHNSVRARWYLRPELETDEDGKSVRADGRLVLELQKTNHGRMDQQIPMRWDDAASMFVAEGGPTRLDASLQDTVERAGIVTAIRQVVMSGDFVPAAAQGPRTALHVLSACESFPESLKNRGGKRRFWRHVEILRRNHTLKEGRMRRNGRHEVSTLELEVAP